MWNRIRALIVKELLGLMKDRRIRLVLIVPPIIQMIIFANAATFDVTGLALGIWDEDGSRPATELVSRFRQSPAFSEVATYARPEDVAAGITEQRVAAVLHLGQRFSADLKSGRQPQVQLILDARRSNTALIVEGYAQTIIEEYAASLGTRAPPGIVPRAWFNPNLSSQWFILPGLVVLLSIVMTLLTTALSVARERELGTFDQLLVTPLRPLEIVIGKTLPSFSIGLMEAGLLVLVATLVYRVPFAGAPLMLLAGLAVFLLSGFGTPIENMPSWCQQLTLIDPIRYMLVLSRGVFLEDMQWDVAATQIWPMAVIGLVTFSFATWLFGRRLG